MVEFCDRKDCELVNKEVIAEYMSQFRDVGAGQAEFLRGEGKRGTWYRDFYKRLPANTWLARRYYSPFPNEGKGEQKQKKPASQLSHVISAQMWKLQWDRLPACPTGE